MTAKLFWVNASIRTYVSIVILSSLNTAKASKSAEVLQHLPRALVPGDTVEVTFTFVVPQPNGVVQVGLRDDSLGDNLLIFNINTEEKRTVFRSRESGNVYTIHGGWGWPTTFPADLGHYTVAIEAQVFPDEAVIFIDGVHYATVARPVELVAPFTNANSVRLTDVETINDTVQYAVNSMSMTDRLSYEQWRNGSMTSARLVSGAVHLGTAQLMSDIQCAVRCAHALPTEASPAGCNAFNFNAEGGTCELLNMDQAEKSTPQQPPLIDISWSHFFLHRRVRFYP